MTATVKALGACDSSVVCAHCAMPFDAQTFDVSGLGEPPPPGRLIVLARFELPPEYCGTLEYFAQFTDAYGKDRSAVQTPGLSWSVRVNQRPLNPYLDLQHILNPWGIGGFPMKIRLDDGAALELVVRTIGPNKEKIALVGGRLMGRYWYNRAFGDVERPRR
jgi:hypothetical protein